MSYTPKKKRPLSICVSTFPDQFKRLHPERSAAGGVKARSASEEVRMAVYRPIAELYKQHNKWCQCCVPVKGAAAFETMPSEQVHHVRGREGLLLFDVRYFRAVCAACHRWIHDNPEKAARLGLLGGGETAGNKGEKQP